MESSDTSEAEPLNDESLDEAGALRLAEFAKAQLSRYVTYHNHKENMAYVVLALFTVATGTILTMEHWPPVSLKSNANAKLISLGSMVVFWALVRTYLAFQLHRRRWAALRIAGCERVLANWCTGNLKADSLEPKERKDDHKPAFSHKMLNIFWPHKKVVPVLKKEAPLYPSALVDSWLEVEDGKQTDALRHERFVVSVGWLLFTLTIIRTVYAA